MAHHRPIEDSGWLCCVHRYVHSVNFVCLSKDALRDFAGIGSAELCQHLVLNVCIVGLVVAHRLYCRCNFLAIPVRDYIGPVLLFSRVLCLASTTHNE